MAEPHLKASIFENVPLYGYDRVVNWAYPGVTNTAPPKPGNLLENGSFEVGLSHGWGFLAEVYDRPFSIGSLVDTNQAFHGTASITFPIKGRLTSKIYTIRPNRIYTLSAWARSSAPSGLGFGIYNVETPPPASPPVTNIYQSFSTAAAHALAR